MASDRHWMLVLVHCVLMRFAADVELEETAQRTRGD